MKSCLIPEPVLRVLSTIEIDGNVVRLTAQLPRPLYTQTNTVLEALGGTWNRKANGHTFTVNPEVRLEEAMLTRSYERPGNRDNFGFFETPEPLAQQVIDDLDLEPHHLFFDTSAGRGRITDQAAKIVGHAQILLCEIQEANRQILTDKGYTVHGTDFMTWSPPCLVDRVGINPPFERQADIQHVTKAFSHLKPNGKLTSIMSAGVSFREDRRARAFRDLVQEYGTMRPLPDQSFKESGTNVSTVLVSLTHP
ncbi:MAG: SAM-dependent methyltransferase [Nitrospirota bacterium]|jgi:hypothetical protein|nr:SAM-dependent methyltransferase [Nitrospirota bacterium]